MSSFWDSVNERTQIENRELANKRSRKLASALKQLSTPQGISRTAAGHVVPVKAQNPLLTGLMAGASGYLGAKADATDTALKYDNMALKQNALRDALKSARGVGGGGMGNGGGTNTAGYNPDAQASQIGTMMEYYPEIGNKMLESQIVPTNEMRNLQNAGISPNDYYNAKMQTNEGKNARDPMAQQFIEQNRQADFNNNQQLQNDRFGNSNYELRLTHQQQNANREDTQSHDFNIMGSKYNNDKAMSQFNQDLQNKNTMTERTIMNPDGSMSKVPMTKAQELNMVGGGGNVPQPTQSRDDYIKNLIQSGLPDSEIEPMLAEFDAGGQGQNAPMPSPFEQNAQNQPMPQPQQQGGFNPLAVPVQSERQKLQDASNIKLKEQQINDLTDEYKKTMIPAGQTERSMQRMVNLLEDKKNPVHSNGIGGTVEYYSDKYMPEFLGADPQQASNTDEFQGLASDVGAGRLQMFGGSDTNQEFKKAVEGAGGDTSKSSASLVNLLKRQQQEINQRKKDYNNRVQKLTDADYMPSQVVTDDEGVSDAIPSREEMLKIIKARGR